jgi:hypothetical protein
MLRGRSARVAAPTPAERYHAGKESAQGERPRVLDLDRLQSIGVESPPGPLLARALDYINTKVAAMVEAIRDRHLEDRTSIIRSAKHGQSPQTPSA